MKRVVCLNVMKPGILHLSDYFGQFYERFCAEQEDWKILGKVDVVGLIEERCRNGRRSVHYVLEQDARAQEFDVLLICSAKQISQSSEMVGSYVKWFSECGVEVWSICEGRLGDIFSEYAKVIPLREFVKVDGHGASTDFATADSWISDDEDAEVLDGYVVAEMTDGQGAQVMERMMIQGRCLGGWCRRCRGCFRK